ncbi:MAG: hypothetical protein NC916_03300 [Candidatus Omnitrophica bacterium]|nr:hypothetical protein [Candidatus Omnitrophota bacterium]
MLKKRNGQSVLEYVIILSIVIAAIVLFAQGTLKTKVGESLNKAADEMVNMMNKFDPPEG